MRLSLFFFFFSLFAALKILSQGIACMYYLKFEICLPTYLITVSQHQPHKDERLKLFAQSPPQIRECSN